MNKNNQVNNRKWYVLLFVILIPAIAGLEKVFGIYCYLFDCDKCEAGQVLVDLPRVLRQDIIELDKIESKEYSNNFLVDSSAQFDYLSDYYLSNNRYLLSPEESFSDLNVLIASAGLGKSLIYRKIKNILNRDTSATITKISLNEICDCEKKSCKGFEQLAQLSNNFSGYDYIFNSLPYLSKDLLQSKINKKLSSISHGRVNYIVIDDCDEWHPKAISSLTEIIIDKSKRQTDSTKYKFILLGRAEGFKAFLKNTNRPPFSDFKIYFINLPEYRTTGDIQLRIGDYKTYESPQLDSALVYERILKADNNMQSFVLRELGNLSSGNYLLEEFNKDNISSIDSLKYNLFYAYIGRNIDTHCRPGKDDDLYIYLLQSVARMYLSEVDNEGYFRVNNRDKVIAKFCTGDDEKKIELLVQDLLDFSGLIDYKPLTGQHIEYRFYPIWLHSFIAEM